MGATAVVSMRYCTNELSSGVVEVLAYGTAVSTTEPSPGAAGASERRWVSTANEVPGRDALQSLGVVRGITVRSRNVVATMGAALKTIVGGEIRTWTNLCETSREEAFARMLQQAAARGANGIAGFRYSTNEVVPGVTEVLAYGTAISETTRPSWEMAV